VADCVRSDPQRRRRPARKEWAKANPHERLGHDRRGPAHSSGQDCRVVGVMLGVVAYGYWRAQNRRLDPGPDRAEPGGAARVAAAVGGRPQLFLKEDVLPDHVNKFYFVLAPMLVMIRRSSRWRWCPGEQPGDRLARHQGVIADLNIGILYVFAISSLSVYGSSWPGGRATPSTRSWRHPLQPQMISYEVCLD